MNTLDGMPSKAKVLANRLMTVSAISDITSCRGTQRNSH